ncbi:hypothetical protein KBK24_0130950 [Burkholderia sp. K24]|nr:hypothetical protein KBK24_0130950 [Burkholderia sp. K24]
MQTRQSLFVQTGLVGVSVAVEYCQVAGGVMPLSTRAWVTHPYSLSVRAFTAPARVHLKIPDMAIAFPRVGDLPCGLDPKDRAGRPEQKFRSGS